MINWETIIINQKKSIPRWVIFSIDIGICLFSICFAFMLRFNFNINEILHSYRLEYSISVVIFLRITAFLITKTYSGIIRYTGSQDAVRIFVAVFASSLTMYLFDISHYYFFKRGVGLSLLPIAVVIIDFLITLMLMTSIRLGYKLLYRQVKNASIEKSRVLIYGAGQMGLITKRALDHDTSARFKIIAFLDNDPSKVDKTLEGVKIIKGDEELDSLIEGKNIDQVIIAIQDISQKKKKLIIETCLQYGVKVSTIPPVAKWINGELAVNQIKTVKIEDLLGREPIELDNENVTRQYSNKVIMVTGAAGSIGSEIARQIIQLNPDRIILIDSAETPLYELQFELKNDSSFISFNRFEFVIADIKNEHVMRNIFMQFKPDKVFHAAAYKHVPLMENHPSRAIENNVLGTKIIADLAVEFNVSKFVMVSTDKAVNPTNVMGASKRIAEIYVQSLNNLYALKGDTNYTKFITTRFGNVLGSNGSVIPVFRKQIENGGPITVTHPDITRYFMTIPEACQLVLEAGAMGKGGEIFLFDMGQSVKIIDLARKMIKLSGLEEGKDIEIKFTGLRPGEKIYEELLNNDENTLPTHHPQITIGKVLEYDYNEVSNAINNLIISAGNEDNMNIVRHMKMIVPEFKSNNSEYEILDKELAYIQK